MSNIIENMYSTDYTKDGSVVYKAPVSEEYHVVDSSSSSYSNQKGNFVPIKGKSNIDGFFNF